MKFSKIIFLCTLLFILSACASINKSQYCEDSLACWEREIIKCNPGTENRNKVCSNWINGDCLGQWYIEKHVIIGQNNGQCVVDEGRYTFLPETDDFEYNHFECFYKQGKQNNCNEKKQ
ncbi:hypothetical protein ACFLZ9_00350 [Patescibacteria group bacterium]